MGFRQCACRPALQSPRCRSHMLGVPFRSLPLSWSRVTLLVVLTLFFAPAAWRFAVYWRAPASEWRSADRSSAGLLASPSQNRAATVRIYAAPTVSWRGIFAVHSWIVLKDHDAPAYERYDLTAWGDPIRLNGFDPDGRWFGQVPQLVFGADGDAASALIGRMRAAIGSYRFRNRGDYRAWPGPNSNTFVATVVAAVPEAHVVLPPNAVGKDFPLDGRIVDWTPSRTGIRFSAGGYLGLTLAWVEGVELNILGGVIGLDIRRPALKLPAVGRLGVPLFPESRLPAHP